MKVGNQQIIVRQQRQRVCVVEPVIADRYQRTRSGVVKTTRVRIAHKQHDAWRRLVVWIVWIRGVVVTARRDYDEFATGFGSAGHHRKSGRQTKVELQIVGAGSVTDEITVSVKRDDQGTH